jgi:hypothetical protein
MSNVVIGAKDFPGYYGPRPVDLCIVAEKGYVASGGKIISKGSIKDGIFLIREACTDNSGTGVLTTPQVTVEATMNAEVNNDATLTAYLVAQDGRVVSRLSVFKSFQLAATTPTTWNAIATANYPQ